MSSPELAVDEQAVLDDLTRMIAIVLEDIGPLDAEITPDTTFRDDLDLESIDLVALGGLLGEQYGDRVNFAEFVADLDLEEIIALTVGDLVDYVLASLRAED
ncbi:MAG TPA: phosphopantetheine-binding protein [Pseudonocardiaceae bacterium]|jgi:acyl carrier protein|nr:phosphopantetheine-binding protein [Pseudonocardiaceae bacterium]